MHKFPKRKRNTKRGVFWRGAGCWEVGDVEGKDVHRFERMYCHAKLKPLDNFVRVSTMPPVLIAWIYHLMIIMILCLIKPASRIYIVTSPDVFISDTEANSFRGVALYILWRNDMD